MIRAKHFHSGDPAADSDRALTPGVRLFARREQSVIRSLQTSSFVPASGPSGSSASAKKVYMKPERGDEDKKQDPDKRTCNIIILCMERKAERDDGDGIPEKKEHREERFFRSSHEKE